MRGSGDPCPDFGTSLEDMARFIGAAVSTCSTVIA